MFGFFGNIYGSGRPYIYVIADDPTDVTVTVPYYPDSLTFRLKRFARIYLSNSVSGYGDQELSNKGVEITSRKPITVYAHHYKGGRSGRSAEGTLIMPEECASTDYVVVSHDESPSNSMKSQFMLLGLTDNTKVSIELPSFDTKEITLDRFGSYQYREQDLTGAMITADAPIVALAGHTCANVPTENTAYCDYIMEQMPPCSSLKNAYIVSYLKPRPHFSVRIVAAYDGTAVSIRDATGVSIQNVSLNRAESVFSSFENRATISITSNKGVLLAQYAHGASTDSLDYGDPSMAVLPGLGQFERDYNLHAPREFYKVNFVTIVMSDAYDISSFKLNSDPIDSTDSIAVSVPGYGNYNVLHVQTFKVLSRLTHSDKDATYSALLYGYNTRVGYSWLAGRIV